MGIFLTFGEIPYFQVAGIKKTNIPLVSLLGPIEVVLKFIQYACLMRLQL